MNFKGIRVLILEGYARQSLPVMRAFKSFGCKVSVLCNSKTDIAYASRLPDNKILGICDPERYEETVECIRNLIKAEAFDIVFPLVDFSAKILSYNKPEFDKYAKIIANDKDVFDLAQDKLSVMKICTENGIPCPKTVIDALRIDDVLDAGFTFPIIIKPRRECGAKGIRVFSSKNEFIKYAEQNNIHFPEYVIQEFIPQDLQNMSGNLFIDKKGCVKSNYVYASYRWFPLKGGTGTFNITVDEPQAIEYGKKLAELLNLRGCCGIDFIKDPRDGSVKVLEINPRIMACSQIGFLSGVNAIQQVLEDEYADDVSPMLSYRKDIRVRMSQTDILWFLKSPDRFKAKPSFFSIKNTKDQTFSWDDPLPWFAFLFNRLTQYIKNTI